MQASSVFCVVVATAVMTGCMTQSPKFDSMSSSTCDNKRVCAVPVTVVNCVVSIPADKNTLVMSGGPIAILWYLQPAAILQKYAFDSSKGVVLKTSDASQFPTQQSVLNDHGYLWVNRNSDYKTYEYSINVVDNGNGGRACPVLDPRIYNQ